jgi:hypothetical protein
MCKVCEQRTNTKSIEQYVECNDILSKERSTEYVQHVMRTSYPECLKTYL